MKSFFNKLTTGAPSPPKGKVDDQQFAAQLEKATSTVTQLSQLRQANFPLLNEVGFAGFARCCAFHCCPVNKYDLRSYAMQATRSGEHQHKTARCCMRSPLCACSVCKQDSCKSATSCCRLDTLLTFCWPGSATPGLGSNGPGRVGCKDGLA